MPKIGDIGYIGNLHYGVFVPPPSAAAHAELVAHGLDQPGVHLLVHERWLALSEAAQRDMVGTDPTPITERLLHRLIRL